MWSTRPTAWTIWVLELTANTLPTALPPTVSPATRADMTRLTPLGQETSTLARISAAMVAEAEPEMTPQISPTTSLQMELTRSALRSRRMAAWAPGTFRAAIEWKGFSSALATAMPMMSKRMPITTMASRMTKATATPLLSMTSSDTREMMPEMTMVIKKTVTTHLIVLLRSRLEASGSALPTNLHPWSKNGAAPPGAAVKMEKDGSRQDKSYGLGRVVFHRSEPAVAAQAVSI